mmetsp:Transcript_38308/g.120139  ORF Transcript_38308/g.120139 Transcript_38308/m.120139 type:complete len:235 (-) Transcript_38308:93-797(-)
MARLLSPIRKPRTPTRTRALALLPEVLVPRLLGMGHGALAANALHAADVAVEADGVGVHELLLLPERRRQCLRLVHSGVTIHGALEEARPRGIHHVVVVDPVVHQNAERRCLAVAGGGAWHGELRVGLNQTQAGRIAIDLAVLDSDGGDANVEVVRKNRQFDFATPAFLILNPRAVGIHGLCEDALGTQQWVPSDRPRDDAPHLPHGLFVGRPRRVARHQPQRARHAVKHATII